MNRLKYAVSITDEAVNVNTPIMLHGSFEECFRAAADCGYDGVELQIKDPATRSVSQLKQLMKEYHLQIPAITTGSEYFGNGLSRLMRILPVSSGRLIGWVSTLIWRRNLAAWFCWAPCAA